MRHFRELGVASIVRSLVLSTLLVVPALTACASSGPGQLPEPRTLVLRSGARLSVDESEMERMRFIYNEVDRELRNIEVDPSFLIGTRADPRDLYPWETLDISGDTAWVNFNRTHPEVSQVYQIYAHLHLMRRMDRLDEWLPDVADAEGWPLEQAIMTRVAEAWLLGRALYDFTPYELLDELAYAFDAGWLDAMLLQLRANEFSEAREEWLAADPAALDGFSAWFRETFDRPPPGPTTPE
jgi:hypothetical protein